MLGSMEAPDCTLLCPGERLEGFAQPLFERGFDRCLVEQELAFNCSLEQGFNMEILFFSEGRYPGELLK